MVKDEIFHSFLVRQHEAALALSAKTDLLEVEPVDPYPSWRYAATFHCQGLVRGRSGVEIADRFDIGVAFPSDYLRRADTFQVLTWLAPLTVFHPNITFPHMCVGRLLPGTELVDILYQCHAIIRYAKVTMREDDSLNIEACRWARQNLHRFPIDSRPLIPSTPDMRVTELEQS